MHEADNSNLYEGHGSIHYNQSEFSISESRNTDFWLVGNYFEIWALKDMFRPGDSNPLFYAYDAYYNDQYYDIIPEHYKASRYY